MPNGAVIRGQDTSVSFPAFVFHLLLAGARARNAMSNPILH